MYEEPYVVRGRSLVKFGYVGEELDRRLLGDEQVELRRWPQQHRIGRPLGPFQIFDESTRVNRYQ